MNKVEEIVSLFKLPTKSILNQNVPKSFFTKEFELIPEEKRLLAKPHLIENINWRARLRLNTVNIPPYQSETERFVELQIFTIEVKKEVHDTYFPKLENLFFKHIPFPIILISAGPSSLYVSFSKHHINQNQSNQLVIDRIFQIELPLVDFSFDWASPLLSLEKMPVNHLKSLYFRYLKTFIAMKVAVTIDKRVNPESLERMEEAYNLLQGVKKCNSEIKILKKAIRKSRQINKRVEMGNKMHDFLAEKDKILNELQRF